MISKEKVARINQLAKKHKEKGLTKEEKKEREILRREYIDAIKGNVKDQLSRIRYVEDMEEENDKDDKINNSKKN